VWLAVAVLAACTAPPVDVAAWPLADRTAARDADAAEDPRHVVRPVLGAGFGVAITIEALVATDPAHADSVLLVRGVDGARLDPARPIWWTYGTDDAEDVPPTGRNEFVLEPGCVYRLRGYEVGSWSGYVWTGGDDDLDGLPASDAGFDDFGPRQAVGAAFHNEFRVVAGVRIERGTLPSADPFALSRYGKGDDAIRRMHRPRAQRP
jgi:hypothetical protein